MSEVGEEQRAEDDGMLYVYGVVPAGATSVVPGLEDARIELLERESLAVMTSRTPRTRIRPSRANLLAHQRVIEDAHEQGPVVPVRFGTILPDEDAVTGELLQPNRDRLVSLLDSMSGRDEFRLRVSYFEDVLLRQVVQTSAGVRRLRAEAKRAGRRAGRDLMITLGETVRTEIERIREEDSAAILDVVAASSDDVVPLPQRSETVALHAALLVGRDHRSDLEDAVGGIAKRHGERMQIELIGPLPPWDFTELGMPA